MGVVNDLLVRIETGKIRVLIKLDDGNFADAPEPVVLNAEEGDRVRWSFVGLKLQILFGTNVPVGDVPSLALEEGEPENRENTPSLVPEEGEPKIRENTPFNTDKFLAEGNSADFTQNGAIFPEAIELPNGVVTEEQVWEEDNFKYTINLTDLDGTLITLDPGIRRRRLRRGRTD